MSQTELDQPIRQYYKEQCLPPDARGRSWDHCYGFFQKNRESLLEVEVQDAAALHLGCYLTSWGMYRGRFLRKHAYTVHKPVIRVLASSQFSDLWQPDLGSTPSEDIKLAGTIMDLVEKVEAEYRKLTDQQKMDTLVTKVLLGTVGCLPARDSYFETGFKPYLKPGVPYGSLNRRFVETILGFCRDNRGELDELRSEIRDRPYPLMKLVDMYFWQIGKV